MNCSSCRISQLFPVYQHNVTSSTLGRTLDPFRSFLFFISLLEFSNLTVHISAVLCSVVHAPCSHPVSLQDRRIVPGHPEPWVAPCPFSTVGPGSSGACIASTLCHLNMELLCLSEHLGLLLPSVEFITLAELGMPSWS